MSNLLEQINTVEKKPYFIKDLGRVITGKTPSKNNPEDWGSGVDFITPTDIKTEDKFYRYSNRKLSEEGENRFKNIILPPDSILVTCIGTVGKVIMNKEKALSNQQINAIVVENKEFDNNYVFYKILSLVPLIKSSAVGSTMPIINKSSFEEIGFEAPDLSIQKKIVEILNAYDAKIENNNLIISRLEATTQILFNEWFVNFRFPGYEKVKFVESEMGEIPEGWEIKKVSDVSDLNKGVSYTSNEINANNVGTALINLGNFKRGGGFNLNGTKYYTGSFKDSHLVEPGQILVAMTDLTSNREVIGHPARLPGNFKKAVISLDVCSLVPNKDIYNEFLYSLMLRRDFSKLMASCASGTNVSHLSKTHIEEYEFIMPTEKLLIMFNNFVQPLFNKQALIESENQGLNSVKEKLLIKLT